MALLTPARLVPLVLVSQDQNLACPRFPMLRIPLGNSVVTTALRSLGLRNSTRMEMSQWPLPDKRLCGAEWGDLTDPTQGSH